MPTRRSEPKVIRQEVHWVPENRRVFMGHKEHPYRVWTLYPHTDPNVRPELPITPVHHHNAFLEDYVHDWKMWPDAQRVPYLKYASRAIDNCVWILVEFTDEKSNPWTRKS